MTEKEALRQVLYDLWNEFWAVNSSALCFIPYYSAVKEYDGIWKSTLGLRLNLALIILLWSCNWLITKCQPEDKKARVKKQVADCQILSMLTLGFFMLFYGYPYDLTYSYEYAADVFLLIIGFELSLSSTKHVKWTLLVVVLMCCIKNIIIEVFIIPLYLLIICREKIKEHWGIFYYLMFFLILFIPSPYKIFGILCVLFTFLMTLVIVL